MKPRPSRFFPRLSIFIATSLSLAQLGLSTEFLLNQVGYYPEKEKIAFVADSASQSFTVIDASTSEVALTGNLGATATYSDGGLSVRVAEFSSITIAGMYKLRLEDGTLSPTFSIGPDQLREAQQAALKSFYFNRSSQEISSALGGAWARPAGHLDTSVRYHSSTGHADGFAPSPKGWYDAGDYGKYVVNGGYAVGTLLSLHEMLPDYTGDATGIPESGNQVSDLLDEARWELEWFLTMQDSDGGVFHKCTTLNFVGFVMPHQTQTQRYFIGKSVTATLNFAAALGQAARIWKDLDPTFSNTCLLAAERAWTWAKANPNALYRNNPSGVATGAYGDGNASDEFDWAAAQLFLTTGKTLYQNDLANLLAAPQVDSAAGWPTTRNLGIYSLATLDSSITDTQRTALRNAIVARASTLLTQIANNAIRGPLFGYEYYWGSNGQAASKGVLLAYAYQITGETRFAQGMADIADYLLGRNATGYSFLTGFGSKTPMNIHHRPSGADGVVDPIPGFLSGGPNQGYDDGLSYPFPQPARAFLDVEASYASNEIAINWNAPFTFLLAALDSSQSVIIDPQPDFYYTTPGTVLEGPSVLDNDSNQPNALVATLVDGPLLGSEFQLAANGTISYTPNADLLGNDYFTYTVRNGTETSEPILVTITVAPSTDDFDDPNPSAYDAWLWNYPSLSGDEAEPDADPDLDGVSNIWESLALSDPTQRDSEMLAGLRFLAPTPGIPLRAALRVTRDYARRIGSLTFLSSASPLGPEWLEASATGDPVFRISEADFDPADTRIDLLIELQSDLGDGLYLKASAQKSAE